MPKGGAHPHKQPTVWDFTLWLHRDGSLSIQSSTEFPWGVAEEIVELTLKDDQDAVMEIVRLELSRPMKASPIR